MSSLTRTTATVVSIQQLTHDVRQIDLELLEPPVLPFKAGQFISFDVPDPRTGRLVTRPYSIASSPENSRRLSLVLNLVAGGPGSTYLFGLRPGDKTSFAGPAGHFYLRQDQPRDLLLVATGTGIAPLRSMLLANAALPTPQRATLLWGLRSQRDLYYQEELAELHRRHQNFSSTPVLSRPEAGWTGETGRVTDVVRQQITEVRRLAVYLCGNSGMIKDVTSLIQAKGLCPIYREKYYDDKEEGHAA